VILVKALRVNIFFNLLLNFAQLFTLSTELPIRICTLSYTFAKTNRDHTEPPILYFGYVGGDCQGGLPQLCLLVFFVFVKFDLISLIFLLS